MKYCECLDSSCFDYAQVDCCMFSLLASLLTSVYLIFSLYELIYSQMHLNAPIKPCPPTCCLVALKASRSRVEQVKLIADEIVVNRTSSALNELSPISCS